MIKKLVSKVLEESSASKMVKSFDKENYVNTLTEEVIVSAAQVKRFVKTKQAELEEKLASPEIVELKSEIDSAINVISELEAILKSREFKEDDKICISLTRDEVAEVFDANTGETSVSTNEVVDTTEFIHYEVKYSLLSVDEYNSVTGLSETEESYYYDLIHVLLSNGLGACLRYAKTALTDFTDEVRGDIITKNYEWHTLNAVVGVSAIKFDSLIKLYPEVRASLLERHYIKVSTEQSKKKFVQGDIFDNVEATAVELVVEGEFDNE